MGKNENSPTSEHLTEEHFPIFGYIVSTYAKVEHGFKLIIGKMIGTPDSVALIVCEPYSTLALLKVVRSLCDSDVPNDWTKRDEWTKRILGLVEEFELFGPLRNEIAHDLWTEGEAEGSIKPFGLNIGAKKKLITYKGIEDNESEWTLEGLRDEAVKLHHLHNSLTQLLGDLGPE